MTDIIWIIASVALCVCGFFWRRHAAKKLALAGTVDKKLKRGKLLPTIIIVIGLYLLVTRIIKLIFGVAENNGLEFSLWPERIDFYGFSMSITVIHTWIAMAILIVVAIILRLTVIKKLKDPPKGAQNVLELIVEAISNYTNSQAHGAGEFLGSYVFTIGAFLVACAVLELFRIRTPASDIMMTFSMALMTFFLINWYGIKKKGIKGRIKSLASPTPVVLIIRVLTDIAIPVSMASRLFGNMLGGMIVMDLIYTSLGNNAVGFPSVVGLYFNVFHPLIQAFIFITLTLTFINEAIE